MLGSQSGLSKTPPRETQSWDKLSFERHMMFYEKLLLLTTMGSTSGLCNQLPVGRLLLSANVIVFCRFIDKKNNKSGSSEYVKTNVVTFFPPTTSSRPLWGLKVGKKTNF